MLKHANARPRTRARAAQARAGMFRTWGSALQMLPIGGRAVWGNTTWAPDDTPFMQKAGLSYG